MLGFALEQHELVAFMRGRIQRHAIRHQKTGQAHVRGDIARKAADHGVVAEVVIQAHRARQIVRVVVDRAIPFGREVRERARVAEISLGAADGRGLPAGRAIAARRNHARRWSALAFLREHIDHPADRLRAVERTARAAQNLDAIEIVGGQIGHVEAAGRARVDFDPIDKDQRLRRGRAANRYARDRARRAALRDLHAGDFAQYVLDPVDLLLLDLRLLDDGYCGADAGDRLLDPGRGDDHRIELLRLLWLGRRRRLPGLLICRRGFGLRLRWRWRRRGLIGPRDRR